MDGAVRRPRSAGLSLIELVIAISLASVVLAVVVDMSTMMVRFQLEGVRKGALTGWSLISFSQMSKEIESANVLVWPSATTPADDVLVTCANWSRLAGPSGGKLDDAALVEVFYYCFNAGEKSLWRYYINGAASCPSAPPSFPACDGVAAGFSLTERTQIGWKIERLNAQSIFIRDDAIGGVRLRYVVGEQTATEQLKSPIFTPFDVGLVLRKQYGNTAD